VCIFGGKDWAREVRDAFGIGAFGGKKGNARYAKAQGRKEILINIVRSGCRDTLRRVSDQT
jgi:hypothetical protein